MSACIYCGSAWCEGDCDQGEEETCPRCDLPESECTCDETDDGPDDEPDPDLDDFFTPDGE